MAKLQNHAALPACDLCQSLERNFPMPSKKEFTVADMIKALAKLDPTLPIYDHYYDEEEGEEVWFNVVKPTPKKVTIYLTALQQGKKIKLQWSDNKNAGQVVDKKKAVILYPPAKDEIEL